MRRFKHLSKSDRIRIETLNNDVEKYSNIRNIRKAWGLSKKRGSGWNHAISTSVPVLSKFRLS